MEIISRCNRGISIVVKCIEKHGKYFQAQSRHLYYKKIYNQAFPISANQKLFASGIQKSVLSENAQPIMGIIFE